MYFTRISSFNHHNNPVKWVHSPHFTVEEPDVQKSLAKGGAEFQGQTFSFQNLFLISTLGHLFVLYTLLSDLFQNERILK